MPQKIYIGPIYPKSYLKQNDSDMEDDISEDFDFPALQQIRPQRNNNISNPRQTNLQENSQDNLDIEISSPPRSLSRRSRNNCSSNQRQRTNPQDNSSEDFNLNLASPNEAPQRNDVTTENRSNPQPRVTVARPRNSSDNASENVTPLLLESTYP